MITRFYKGTSALIPYRGKYDWNPHIRLQYCLLLPLLAFTAGCASLRYCGSDEPWLGVDKQKHFLASAAMSAGITAAASTGMDSEDALAVGIISATGAGVTKEWYDSEVKKTCFSWKDLAWDFIGASIGASMAAAATD